MSFFSCLGFIYIYIYIYLVYIYILDSFIVTLPRRTRKDFWIYQNMQVIFFSFVSIFSRDLPRLTKILIFQVSTPFYKKCNFTNAYTVSAVYPQIWTVVCASFSGKRKSRASFFLSSQVGTSPNGCRTLVMNHNGKG